MIVTEKTPIFAPYFSLGMETITLRFDPDSEFAKALESLIQNSNEVSVVERKKSKKILSQLDLAIQEEKEGKVNVYSSVDEFFEKMGIQCTRS